ncbi:MAG: hypothetical protein Q8P82_00375, partial [bacterium]|nr:hypothetical protein [bacterium]
MSFRIILLIIAAFFLGLVQAGFIPALPAPFRFFALMPLALVCLVVFRTRREAIIAALISGLILDNFADTPFGTQTVILLLQVMIVSFLFFRWFANQAPLSLLILTAAAVAGNVLLLAAGHMVWFLLTGNEMFAVSFREIFTILSGSLVT